MHTLADGFTSFTEPIPTEFFIIHSREFDVNIDAVEQWTGDLFLIFGEDGWRLYVATSKARPYALRIVEHFGLAPFFAETYGSGLDGSLMHKDALLAHAFADAGVDPRAAVMIGDRKFDVLGAKANGAPTIGVAWGYGSRAELDEAGAAAIVATPSEVDGALAAVAS